MSVFLTHAYFISEDPKEQKIMRPYPPLGLLYIAAFLEENGIPTTVFDSTFQHSKALEEALIQQQPAIICIYVNLMTRIGVIRLIRFIKENLPQSQIILGGPEVKHHAENLLKIGANYIVIGEGEQTSFELISALLAGVNPKEKDIAGLAYLLADKLVTTQERKKIKHIDELPFPARDKIAINQYQEVWRKHHGKSTISISSMRGCPYTCKWCSRAVYGLSYRRRSPALVVAEIAHIYEQYQPDSLWFVDDVFTVNHKWLRSFVEEIKKRKLNISYECISRADRMNDEVIQLLKESGCFRIWIGAESGSQKIIDLMDRRVDVHKVREMIQASRKAGIEAGTFIMLGYPGETKEDILETIQHLKESNPHHFTITITYPIKGTDLFTEVEAIQTKDFDWENHTDRDRDFQRSFSRKFYDFAVRRVVNEVKFYQEKQKGNLFSKTALRQFISYQFAKMGMWLYK